MMTLPLGEVTDMECFISASVKYDKNEQGYLFNQIH